jgi:hypothetical protein
MQGRLLSGAESCWENRCLWASCHFRRLTLPGQSRMTNSFEVKVIRDHYIGTKRMVAGNPAKKPTPYKTPTTQFLVKWKDSGKNKWSELPHFVATI